MCFGTSRGLVELLEIYWGSSNALSRLTQTNKDCKDSKLVLSKEL